MILRYLPTVLLIIKNTVNHLLMAHDDVVIAGIGFFTYNIINLLLAEHYSRMLCKKLENLKLRIRKLNLLIFPNNHPLNLCSCQVRNKKKLIFFINGEPLARFPMLLLYNFVFSLLLLIIPSSSLKVIKVPSDFNMLIIIHQHIINEISDYFFIKLIQLTKLC